MPPVTISRGDTAHSETLPATSRRSAVPTLPPVRLSAFEGPLDLLLHLVRAGRMDVFDLPIATLCDQYLAYLAAMEALDLNIAGEFLVMAATLLEIKSRLLLPPPPREESESEDSEAEADPRAELVQRLLEYGRYQSIAESLRGVEGERRSLFFRAATEYGREFAPPPRFGEMSADALLKALQRMLEAMGIEEAGERAVTSIRRRKITLRMKMRETMAWVERAGPDGLGLDALLPEPPFARLEVVLLFLSLLELLRSGTIRVIQETFCGEIRVFFVAEADRPTAEAGLSTGHRDTAEGDTNVAAA